MNTRTLINVGLSLVAAGMFPAVADAEGWQVTLGGSYRSFDAVDFNAFNFRNYGNLDGSLGRPLGAQNYSTATFAVVAPGPFSADHIRYLGGSENIDGALAPVIGFEKVIGAQNALSFSWVANGQYYQLGETMSDEQSFTVQNYQHMAPFLNVIVPAPIAGPFAGFSAGTAASVRNQFDLDLLVLDLGAKADCTLGKRFGMYGAVGPTLNFSDMKTSQQEAATWNPIPLVAADTGSYQQTHNDDRQAVTVGGYVALGVQFQLTKTLELAVEYRYDAATNDVSTDLASVDLTGSSAQLKLSFQF